MNKENKFKTMNDINEILRIKKINLKQWMISMGS
jgi:hypothetical protein